MGDHNSQSLEFYLQVLVRTYLDQVSAIVPQSEIAKDVKKLTDRCYCEGLSFLTKTLPRLGKAVDASLSHGTKLTTQGFALKPCTELPAFAWTLFSLVFRSDGIPWFATEGPRTPEDLMSEELEGHTDPGRRKATRGDCKVTSSPRRETQALALKALRQVCYGFYKLNIPHHEEQEEEVLSDFAKTDAELSFKFADLCSTDQAVITQARRLIGRVLANACPMSGVPKHGPGAVATGEKSPEKHTFGRFYRRLDAVFKYDEWFFCNSSHIESTLVFSGLGNSMVTHMEELEAGTAKVVLVPKDSRGPRLISCEPLEYQWVQQALLSVLVPTIENHPLTRGHVNFTDQSVNRRLALEGSRSFEWVTLDMKEASDRVSLELVKELFPPRWYEALYACRSPSTRLPNGQLVHMKKFAPMGSAVCFPVEALVFWALGTAALMNTHGWTPREASANIYVYGDDIVCKEVDHLLITHTYPKFGLMLNQAKCCIAGPFKESCGMDAFYGHPVTPTRIRCMWYNHRKPGALAPYVALSNNLYENGCVAASYYIEEVLQEIWNHQIPVVSHRNPSGIAFVRPDRHVRHANRPENLRYNSDLQRLEVRGFTLHPTVMKTSDEGWNLLTRLLAEMESKTKWGVVTPPSARRIPTGHYAIAHRERLSRAWTAAGP